MQKNYQIRFEKNSQEIASSLNTGKVEKAHQHFKNNWRCIEKASEKEIALKLRDENKNRYRKCKRKLYKSIIRRRSI